MVVISFKGLSSSHSIFLNRPYIFFAIQSDFRDLFFIPLLPFLVYDCSEVFVNKEALNVLRMVSA